MHHHEKLLDSTCAARPTCFPRSLQSSGEYPVAVCFGVVLAKKAAWKESAARFMKTLNKIFIEPCSGGLTDLLARVQSRPRMLHLRAGDITDRLDLHLVVSLLF